MVSDSSLLNNIQIGTRIEYSGFYGTVKYVGEVQGHTSNWLGIEWDDPRRGKHDGIVAGVRYFQTRHPTSGSFLRPGKVQFGRDALTAVTSRYGKVESDSEAYMNQMKLLHIQKEINAPFLQMVGFDKINQKQSNFQDLQVVSLRLQNVNGPGDVGKLGELCPNIVELDLSKNLLYKWSDIFTICEQLPNLVWLNVSENMLQFPENIDGYCFPSITTLICGEMKLTWEKVLQLSKIFPVVEELRVQFNFISDIEIPDENYFRTLKVLDLEGNFFGTWEKVNKLGVLENLEQLIITNVGISIIKFPDCEPDGKLKMFKNLKQLVISENLIEDWKSVSELNKLPVLEDLRFLKNPVLLSDKTASCVQWIVARIANLKILNGTTIKSDERKGAEYDYVKKNALEWFEVTGINNDEMKTEFLEKHPRYLELLEIYGVPEKSEVITQFQSLRTSLKVVHIQWNESVITKKLPSTLTLQKLIMLVQKLFKLKERPTLFYVSYSQPNIEIEMIDEFKEIGFYSMEDGDYIFVRSEI